MRLLIANTSIDINIDNKLQNIVKLFLNFGFSDRSTSLRIEIIKSRNKSITLSHDNQRLVIAGNDINNLANPYNTIGLLQAAFRFVGIHSIKENVALIHGSSAMFNDMAYCFGDDNINTGKTLGSIECALESQEYIGDEFCFLDLNNFKIFSYPFIPIHFRPDVKKHIKQAHDFCLPKTEYIENDAGYFIKPDKIYTVRKSHSLDAFIFTEFISQNPKIRLLASKESKNYIKITLASHIIKLLYPQYDRMNFADNKDSNSIHNINDITLDNVSNMLSLNSVISQVSDNIPCYRASIKEPCDIISLIDKL